MSELLIHWIVPIALLLAVFPKLDKRLVLLLSPLAIFQDLDHFISAREIFYNVFLFAAILLIAFYFSKKRNHPAIFWIALFFLSSHVLLDLGYPGFAPLYPFSDQHISTDFMVFSVNQDNRLGSLDYYWVFNQLPPNVFKLGEVSVLLSNQTMAIAFLLLALLLAKRWGNK